MTNESWDTFWSILLILMAVALVCAVVRLARGPSVADRVVALDLLAVISVATAAVAAAAYGQYYFFDLAVVLALISFVATVAFARALERRL